MSVVFLSLRSGSSGNCYYIGNETESIIVDMGVGPRVLNKRLKECGLDPSRISMVLVTHDHIDHIKHLGKFAGRNTVPVYAVADLHRSLDNHPCTRGCLSGCRKVIDEDSFIDTGNIKIKSFRVPHDASVTVGYHISFYGERFTLITDAGALTREIFKYASIAKHLVIESNYDLDMLMRGSYTPELKRRIMGGTGHLSNEQTAHLLEEICRRTDNVLKNVFLCHISDNNNTRELAYSVSHEALVRAGADRHVNLVALPRTGSSELFRL